MKKKSKQMKSMNMQMNEDDYGFCFGFFLFRKRRTCIFPAEGRFAALAVNVGHGVQARQQDALLGRTTAHVHPKFKKRNNDK